jgi:hypothetical protein
MRSGVIKGTARLFSRHFRTKTAKYWKPTQSYHSLQTVQVQAHTYYVKRTFAENGWVLTAFV